MNAPPQTTKYKPPWVGALLDKRLSPTELRVYLYLLWRQGNHDCAWPSQAAIAKALDLTEEGVRKIILRLKSKDWIRTVQPEKSGRGHRLRYSCLVPEKTPTTVRPLLDETPNSGRAFSHRNPQQRNPQQRNPQQRNPQQSYQETPNGRWAPYKKNIYNEHIHNTILSASADNTSNPSKSSKRSTPEPSPEAVRLADLLESLIRQRKPDFKRRGNWARDIDRQRKPDFKRRGNWARDIDLMLRIDERKPEAVEAVLRWCQADPFWQNNILSGSKLRKQYDRLDLERMRKPQPRRSNFEATLERWAKKHEGEENDIQ